MAPPGTSGYVETVRAAARSAIVHGSSVVGPLIVFGSGVVAGAGAGAARYGAKTTPSGSASASPLNCATLWSTPSCVAAFAAAADPALPGAADVDVLAATSARSFVFDSWSFLASDRSSSSIFASSDLYDSRFSSSAFSCFSASLRSLRSFATDSVCVLIRKAKRKRGKRKKKRNGKKKRSIRPSFCAVFFW